jgi:hypothetical protein
MINVICKLRWVKSKVQLWLYNYGYYNKKELNFVSFFFYGKGFSIIHYGSSKLKQTKPTINQQNIY